MSDILVAIGTYFSDLGTGLMGGAEMFMTWNNVLTIFFGVFIGCFFGALPGLSISLAVAFVLPFSFSLEPLTALSLLSAVYVGAIYGGSISAILFNTPGTPAAACTTADGFALTKQNRAGKALQMANLASMVGDVTSTVLVILLFPLLAQVAIYFKSPEYFALILFAVMIVGSLSGKSLVLGLISAALGFALSTIGMDPIEGSGRFDFGNVNLLSGISFVPLLIGMFALPEFVAQLTRARRHDKPSAIARSVEVDSNDKLTREEFRTSLPHMVRGGLIGLVLGVIPGLGATPAAFVSYDQAKKRSKAPEAFGTGSLEGIAAAEAGNNGVNGSTLAPLLTLGIPGDVVTAIMLGALLVFNIQPGPMLFVMHQDLVYGLFIALLMCDLALRVVGLIFIRLGRHVSRLPTSYIFPGIITLCLVGTYSVNNNVFDIGVMIAAGVAALVMGRCGLPVIPLIIAFILGPMLERGLRRSLAASHGDPMVLVQSPIALVFYGLTIIALILDHKIQSQARLAAQGRRLNSRSESNCNLQE